jgi:hypothetical protein
VSDQVTNLKIAGSEVEVGFDALVSDTLRELVFDRIKVSAKAIERTNNQKGLEDALRGVSGW